MMYCYIHISVNFEKGKRYDFKHHKLKTVVFNDDKQNRNLKKKFKRYLSELTIKEKDCLNPFLFDSSGDLKGHSKKSLERRGDLFDSKIRMARLSRATPRVSQSIALFYLFYV